MNNKTSTELHQLGIDAPHLGQEDGELANWKSGVDDHLTLYFNCVKPTSPHVEIELSLFYREGMFKQLKGNPGERHG